VQLRVANVGDLPLAAVGAVVVEVRRDRLDPAWIAGAVLQLAFELSRARLVLRDLREHQLAGEADAGPGVRSIPAERRRHLPPGPPAAGARARAGRRASAPRTRSRPAPRGARGRAAEAALRERRARRAAPPARDAPSVVAAPPCPSRPT